MEESLILYIIAAILLIGIPTGCILIDIFDKRKKKIISKAIMNDIIIKINKYKDVQLNMDEEEMIKIMDHPFDKNSSLENGNIYRFVYITKGGSGSTIGSTGLYNGSGMGFISGSSETHDESVVIIKCKDNKVIEINPYNMNDIKIPLYYRPLLNFANNIHINKNYNLLYKNKEL